LQGISIAFGCSYASLAIPPAERRINRFARLVLSGLMARAVARVAAHPANLLRDFLVCWRCKTASAIPGKL
jgi:hypothetical protein